MIKARFSRIDRHMQEVLRGSSSALIIRVLGTVLGFVVSVMIARLLGAEGSGIYFLTVSVVMIASTIGRLGFDNTVVRFIAAHASQKEWADVYFVYRTAIKITGFASAVLSVCLFVGASWLAIDVFGKPFMEVPLQIGAAAVLPFSLLVIYAECLRGLKKIPSSQWIKTVLISLGCLLFLYPSISLWSANGAVMSYVVAVIITAIVAWVLWKRVWMGVAKGQHVSSIFTQKLLQSSWPLFAVMMTGLVMQQAATVFLGVWGSAEDVGVFNIANRVSALLLFPLMAMISILTPKFSEMYKNDEMSELKKLSRKSSRILMIFSVPIAVLVAMYSEWILGFFGAEFIKGQTVLIILLVGVVVNAAAGAVGNILMMSGNERDVRSITFIAALLTVVMLFFFIPVWGGIGAAVAVAIGISMQNILMVWRVYKKFGFIPCTVGKV